VLVNNAGLVDAVGKVEDYDDELWDRDMDVNLTGTYNITKPIFKNMCERGWGRIINMSSMAGWQGGFGQASYSTSKAGLIGFGKTLALEGAKHGVTSNVIAPNIVMEDLADLPGEQLEEINPQFEKIRQATPMKSLGKEKDVSNLIAFLASEQSEYITGQVIGVTGGVDLFSF
jgi:NAD(P)-dependent dehydrogenase (short-subunit alcohol dehydrogenase family)